MRTRFLERRVPSEAWLPPAPTSSQLSSRGLFSLINTLSSQSRTCGLLVGQEFRTNCLFSPQPDVDGFLSSHTTDLQLTCRFLLLLHITCGHLQSHEETCPVRRTNRGFIEEIHPRPLLQAYSFHSLDPRCSSNAEPCFCTLKLFVRSVQMADVGTCLPHRPKINDQQSLRLAKGDGFKDPFISGTIFHVDSIPDLYLIKVAFKRPPATVP